MRFLAVFLAGATLALACGVAANAQTSSFTYQGRLQNNNLNATGNYDFVFTLWDAPAGGAQVGSAVTQLAVPVSGGVFTVDLDFGSSSFPGGVRYLDISLRPTGAGSYTSLTPRQQMTSSPYAIRSSTASASDNSLNLGGTPANQFVQTNDARLSDARPPTAGSSNYIQNTTVQQASSSFNISGTGTANIVTAVTQFNLGNNRILFANSSNFFVGPHTGEANTTGDSNSFFGARAGIANTVGGRNSFFGNQAGGSNSSGSENSFFGIEAGKLNTSGAFNSFFGDGAGVSNTTANNNSIFGYNAGLLNTTEHDNTFIGFVAGRNNGTNDSGGIANFNTFVGSRAGFNDTLGGGNSFVGNSAGQGNTTGTNNTAIGASADVGANNLDHATAIGAGTVVSQSNTIALGRADGSDHVQIFGIPGGGGTPLCINTTTHEISTGCSIPIFSPAATEPEATIAWQAQLEALVNLVKAQQAQIEALKQLVCSNQPQAVPCRSK
jgi:hypothetical protein